MLRRQVNERKTNEAHTTPRRFRRRCRHKRMKSLWRLMTLVLFALGTSRCQQVEQPGEKGVEKEKGKIVFVTEEEGNFDIYTMAAAGSEKIRLTYHEAADFDPAWSPDGRQVAFVSLREGDHEAGESKSCSEDNCEIFVVDVDGSNLKRLSFRENSGESDPVWSGDGKQIAFLSQSLQERDSTLSVMNADGSNPVQLTKRGSYAYEPAWSPDGGRIAFRCSGCGNESTEINYDIYLIDVNSRELRRITTHKGGEYNPAWSPDGRKIFFVSDREEDPGIYVVNGDGSDERHLITTVYGDYNMMNVSYWTTFQISPDGEEIVFASDEDGYWQVFIMDKDGTHVEQLTNRLQGAGFPVWYPEGSHIAFMSLGQGIEYDIYIMDKDGDAISKLATGSDVSWSPGLR